MHTVHVLKRYSKDLYLSNLKYLGVKELRAVVANTEIKLLTSEVR